MDLQNSIKLFLAALLNIAVPGSGFVAAGYFRLAITTQVLLIAVTAVTCWTQIIFRPAGALAWILAVVSAHLFSTVVLLYKLKERRSSLRVKSLIAGLAFAAAGIGVFICGFVTKEHWLGVHINFVPSASMQPTLEPGDFILVDTWISLRNVPAINDVVIFTSPLHKDFLVKRIQAWPESGTTDNEGYFVMGDNRTYSTDSRHFGGISREQIKGRVRMVLLSINSDLSLRINRYLKPVR